MAHSFRQPVGAQPSVPVAQKPISGRMVAPICTTGSPAVYPVMPNAYSLLTQQSQQYIAQTVVYPHSLTNVQNRIPYITTSNVPRMFVPVATVPTGISPSAPDHAKLLEEQRRLEKERNFQLQQERLKQFTVTGKKSGINADNLIDNMFGKFQPKKNSGASSLFPSKINEHKEINESENKSKSILSEGEKLKEEPLKSDISPTFPESSTQVISVKKDAKELESMMLECSNLNAPSKALKFHKPSVKEITPSSSHRTVFTASEKSRDWKNLKGLDQVFTAPKPRFPSWCNQDKVPELYKKIQAIVTNDDLHAPDTNLLFPILVSSGLSRELLGEIWELVNESASGQLTIEEMYAALALIAVAQSGHSVKTIDILHKIPCCPVPQLSCFVSAIISQDQTDTSSSVTVEENFAPETRVQPNQSVHQIVRPTAISLSSHSQALSDQKEVTNLIQNVASWTPFAGSSDVPDDEFDDFKSATPTAINFSLGTPLSHIPPVSDDEFDDFKQAPCITKTLETIPVPAVFHESLETKKPESEAILEDLMSPEEDKYSVFRSLQQTDDTSQWGDFTFSSMSNDSSSTFTVETKTNNKEKSSLSYPSVLVTENMENTDLFEISSANIETDSHEDDEFGDFIHASVTPTPPSTVVTDFADFSNFKQPESTSQLNDEFGEFTSSTSASLKPEVGQDFLFHHLKDNISLAESQSVSSLELGTFDGGGGHSGESKSSLSRQGSIPSLDLKSAGLDGTDSEDCFSEIQLSTFVPRNSKSPSPVSNSKGSNENDSSLNPVGQFFQTSSLPLTDKYSVIRQEKTKEEDQHVSCWIRCLQSAVDILQNTKKIFNQMSCSSVWNEVLNSEEGGNYVKNVIEVYKVICRIGLASKSLGKQTEAIVDLLNEADQVWNTICGFFAGCALMPEESSLDFSSGVLRPEPENNAKACGLCLLNIELHSKFIKQEECPKLSYGGRNYHSTCANFWVNCVDPLLPALSLPQLL